MNYAHEIVGAHGGALLPERVPEAKPRNKTPRMYRPLISHDVKFVLFSQTPAK